VKRYVLDASALMAFFEHEPGADRVEELLREAAGTERRLLLSVVNWGEVYYSVWRKYGETMAKQKVEEIARLPIELVDVDLETAKLAATLKAQHKLPYADCFAAALAAQRRALVVTADRDFECLKDAIGVLWATGH